MAVWMKIRVFWDLTLRQVVTFSQLPVDTASYNKELEYS
jgi:hypothetical protein